MAEPSFILCISDNASVDANDAALWYESKSKGLGVQFLMTWKNRMDIFFSNQQHIQGIKKEVKQEKNYFRFFLIKYITWLTVLK